MLARVCAIFIYFCLLHLFSVYVEGGGHACATVHLWSSEDSLQ